MATRMQQRRGTAAQWISTNSGNGPILAAGEIGFESDTNKFKIGDGVNHWVDLTYFTDAAGATAAIAALIDGAPAALDTLNELAAAINDDPNFLSTISTNLSNHAADSTNVHGIANTADLATKGYVDTALGAIDLAAYATKTYADDAVSTHDLDTTNVHGIADTSLLATTTYVDSAVSGATIDQSLLAGVGIDWNANTEAFDIDSTVATKTYADDAVSTHNSDTTLVHGIDDTAELATKTFAAQLLTNATKSNITITGDKTGLTITAENGIADSTTSDLTEGTNLYFTDERAQDAVGNAVGSGLTYTDSTGEIKVTPNTYDAYGSASSAQTAAEGYADNAVSTHSSDSTNVHGITDTSKLVITDATQTLIGKTISAADNTVTVNAADIIDVTATAAELNTLDGITASTAELNILDGITASTAELNTLDGITASVTELNILDGATLSTTELNYVDGVTSAVQDQLDSKMPKSGGTFTGAIYGTTLELSGDLTVNGTFNSVPTETLTVTNPMIYMGDGNPSNVNDLGFVASHTINSTYSHTGLVKDASDGTWKLFTGVTDEPGTTVNFGQASLDALSVGALSATSITVGDVSNTEFGYLNGVTSAIQTQLDDKAPLASPTFTGTVSGLTKSMVGLGNVDNTSDANKPVSTATQTALDLKANSSGPTFTGTVVLPSTTSIGNVSATELGYIDGVTSAIQTQLDAKAPLAAPTFTGTVTLPSTTSVGNVSATELGYLDGVTSAIQTQLDAKLGTSTASSTYAPIASPTFTGTVAGITKSMVGLGSVENTALSTWAGSSSITTLGTVSTGTWSGSTIALNKGGTGATTQQGAANAILPSQASANGKYLTSDGTNVSWGSVSGYSAPTIGSTSIGSGATVSTISGLTANNLTLTGTVTAGSDFGSTSTGGWNQVLASYGGAGVYWTDMPAAGTTLPSQSGYSGLFLTTDGSNLSWGSAASLIPSDESATSKMVTINDNGKMIFNAPGLYLYNHTAMLNMGQQVPLQPGMNTVWYNDSSTSQTITQGSGVTLRWAGTSTTGTRTLAGYGVATLLCVATDVYVISGAGLS